MDVIADGKARIIIKNEDLHFRPELTPPKAAHGQAQGRLGACRPPSFLPLTLIETLPPCDTRCRCHVETLEDLNVLPPY